jgi:hypothetical protein
VVVEELLGLEVDQVVPVEPVVAVMDLFFHHPYRQTRMVL